MLMGGLGKMMEQMFNAQNEVAQVKEDLEKVHVEAEKGAGRVQAIVDGNKKIVTLKLQIDKSDIENTELLEELIVTALNEALSKADIEARKLMKDVAGDLLSNLPAGLNLPGIG